MYFNLLALNSFVFIFRKWRINLRNAQYKLFNYSSVINLFSPCTFKCGIKERAIEKPHAREIKGLDAGHERANLP